MARWIFDLSALEVLKFPRNFDAYSASSAVYGEAIYGCIESLHAIPRTPYSHYFSRSTAQVAQSLAGLFLSPQNQPQHEYFGKKLGRLGLNVVRKNMRKGVVSHRWQSDERLNQITC